MRIFLAIFISAFLLMPTTWAIDIKQAKAQGLIGERNDGYVGYVTKSPNNEVKALVKTINNKRKTVFQETASKTGATTEQVAQRFYQRAVGATKANQYYQDSSGSWVKK